MDAVDWLAGCGVPRADVKGFRIPYLMHNPEQRQVLLAANSFLIRECVTTDTFATVNSRLWPFSLNYGIPRSCWWTEPSGNCTDLSLESDISS